MTPQEEWALLPSLLGCPGKPACDVGQLCVDHKDVVEVIMRERERCEKVCIDELEKIRKHYSKDGVFSGLGSEKTATATSIWMAIAEPKST